MDWSGKTRANRKPYFSQLRFLRVCNTMLQEKTMKIQFFTIGLLVVAFFASASNVHAALMIVESVGNRVILASSFDGSIINANFIVDNDLLTPHSAIDSGRGTIFISDQLLSQVREYSYSGAFLQTVVSSSQINNSRGIAVRDNGLYVTVAGSVAGGPNITNTVQRFDLTTGVQSTFISNFINPTTNLGSPWDVAFRANDVLVTDGTTNTVRRYDLSGAYLGDFATGYSGLRQISVEADGDVLLARNTSGGGVSRLTSTGSFLGGVGLSPSVGAFQLENGNVIYGGGINLWINSGPGVDTPVVVGPGTGFSFRQIEFIAVPEPSSILLVSVGLFGFAFFVKSRRFTKPFSQTKHFSTRVNHGL